jgi:hypothetical protein
MDVDGAPLEKLANLCSFIEQMNELENVEFDWAFLFLNLVFLLSTCVAQSYAIFLLIRTSKWLPDESVYTRAESNSII